MLVLDQDDLLLFQAVQDPSLLDECELDEKTKVTLLENIQQKLTQQAVKIRADVEVACYTYEGILIPRNNLFIL